MSRVAGTGRPTAPKRRIKNLGDHAANITISHPGKSAGMVLRPSTATSYVEREFTYYGDEQLSKHQAEGAAAARVSWVQAETLRLPAELAEARARRNEQRLLRAEAERDETMRCLGHLARRPLSGHRLYYIFLCLLGPGDAVAVTGASLMWGEIWLLAIGQGIASGAAAVAAGFVGADVRDRRDSAARARLAASGGVPDELTGRFPSLFTLSSAERGTYGLALTVAAIIATCLGAAIFALRAAVEVSLLAGLIFGGLAVATCLASFINSWTHADRIADLLERVEVEYRAAETQHERLIRHSAPAERDGAIRTAESIEQEHLLQGAAARAGVLALAEDVMRRHPEIFGHAVDRTSTTEPVGRRWIRDPSSNGHSPLRSVPPFDDWESPGDPPF